MQSRAVTCKNGAVVEHEFPRGDAIVLVVEKEENDRPRGERVLRDDVGAGPKDGLVSEDDAKREAAAQRPELKESGFSAFAVI